MELNFKTFRLPSRFWFFCVAIFVLLLAFMYWQAIGFVIPGIMEAFEIRETMTSMDLSRLIWIPIITCQLSSLAILFLARIFKKLRPLADERLLFFLVAGGLNGLLVGPVGCLCGFISNTLSSGFFGSNSFAAFAGLTLGTAAMFIVCLGTGLKREFH